MVTLIIMAFVVFCFNAYLNYLSGKSMKNKIPEVVSDIYDEEKYQTFKSYKNEKRKISIIKMVIDFVVLVALFLSGAFKVPGLISQNPYVITILTVILYLIIESIFGIGISYYDIFKIEEKYGFNKSTKATFVVDNIKSFIIELVITIGLITLFQLLYTAIGDYIIIAFAAIGFVIIMFVTILMPYFSKAFNKFSPLENVELENRLKDLLSKNGITVKSITVMDASKRTTKPNAYFAGAGKTKSIVLYDTLVNNYSDDEIVAVFAHEMGHAINKDTTRNYFLSFINIVVMVMSVWALLKFDVYSQFGYESINYGLTYIFAFNCVVPIVTPLMQLMMNYFSRKAEYRADAKAKEEGYGDALISALKKLSKDTLSDLSPDKTLVAITYSHPTLAQRIENINK